MKCATDGMLEYNVKAHKVQEKIEEMRVIQQSQWKAERLRNAEYPNWNIVRVRDGSTKQ
jgi:hypothetical protein